MDIVRCQHGFRIALTHTVVGDGNGRMPHAVGQLDDAAGVAEAIHAGKLGVQMQLHPLLRCGILPLFALYDEHIVGVDDIIVFVLVVGAVAAHDEGGALAKALPLGAILTFLCTDLQVDGALIIGDGYGVDLAVVAFDLREEHIAPDDALAALTAQILQRGEVLGGEHFAMENGNRLIGQIQTIHLDGRCGVLFLELDHRRRDLALQFFLQLMLLRLTHGALQRYLRRYPGVRRNALGKQLFKVHLLQKFCAMAHADGDFLANDLDGAPVQKAVDGHAVPLHFVHQAAQSGFIQHGIAKQVLDTQLKAFIVRLQGCQQTGTEIFVQRRTAAQGKDDLPLLPQHLRVLHNDLPEAGRKCRVHHELRPQVGYEWCHKWYSFLYSTNCRTRFCRCGSKNVVLFLCKFLCSENLVALIMIACINTLHIHLTVIDLFRQCFMQKYLDFQIFYRTALHGHQIVAFIHAAPIHHLMQFFFQDAVQPDTGTAATAFPERVRHVHFHIFFNNFIKRGLRHPVNAFQCRAQIHNRCKAEISLCDVYGAHLTGKFVDIFKQIFMDHCKACKCSYRKSIQQTRIIQRQRLLFADPFLFTGKLQFIGQA